MGRPRLGEYIRAIDFLGSSGKYEDSDDDPGNKLIDYERLVNNDDSFNLAELKDGFAAFREKVCVPNFPGRHSGPYWVAYSTICVLDRLKGFEDDNAMREIGRQQFETWLALLRARPSSGHIDLMSKLNDAKYKEYIQSLSGKELGEVFQKMKISYSYDSSDTDDERVYADFLHDGIVMIFKSINEGQCSGCQNEFLDLYGFYEGLLPKMSEIMRRYLGYTIRDMRSVFPDKNPFLDLKDMHVYTQYLKAIKEMLCAFDGDINDLEVENTLKCILKAASKENFILDIYEALIDVVASFIKRDSAPANAERILNLFRQNLFRSFHEQHAKPNLKVFDATVNFVEDILASTKHDGDAEDRKDNDVSKCLNEALEYCVFKFYDLPKTNVEALLNLWIVLLKTEQKSYVYRVYDIAGNDEYAKVIVWKEHLEHAKAFLKTISKVRYHDDTKRYYGDIMKALLESWKKGKVLGMLQKELVDFIFDCLMDESSDKEGLAEDVVDKFFVMTKKDGDLVDYILDKAIAALEKPDMFQNWERATSATIQGILNCCIEIYKGNGKSVSDGHHAKWLSLIEVIFKGEAVDVETLLIGDGEYGTIYLNIFAGVIMKYISLIMMTPRLKDCGLLYRQSLVLAKVAEENDMGSGPYHMLKYMTTSVLALFATNPLPNMGDMASEIVDLFLVMEDCSLMASVMHSVYPLNPNAIHVRIEDLIDRIDTIKEDQVSTILGILTIVATKHPEAISSKDVGKLLEMGLSCTPNLHSTYMAIVLVVARNNPSAVAPHFQKLKNDKRFPKQTKTIRVLIVVPIALCNENLGREGIDFLMSVLSPNDLQDAQVIVSQLSLLAKKEQEYIQKYRPEIEKLQSKTGAHDLKQSCEHLLNVIDGKGLDDIVDAMEQQQMVVTDLETKVGATINTVVSLGDHVLKQGEEIATLTTNVDQIDERVNEVETDLSDTKLKIEEIDNKTITSAPKWSRDLTKLMNPKSSNDWRLLASRLGYKNDDIRAWSQHHDPCMGLLSEWYATHKMSEASKGLLNSLLEMNREDGAIIVENAMKAAEDVVEDEDFEYPSPPPIFLSYQWGIQNEVKLLKQHLQMAGYECWMDIGQMGGGDKLFEKIDNGIRGAKVIVSCTTEKYAKSPNCNREVNLSVNLGKPIIPLLMEKMAWPPKGSMGPIFSEYLFIRSFQRSGEETDDQRFWPVAKFQELLMQLNFYAVPNESLISKDYKNWWIPIVEEIKIDKKKDVKSFGAASNPIEVNSKESPVVFLSYQWGRQTQVKGLYECLTSLGYSVWMDIFQMGGGDSLYDKIDRGIRGCKVVVSCVTPKYALSANCRREMSLADALKKPIIPLLLEQTKWPPDGPMSMVFTELLFINVYRDENIQKTWTGPKIEELVSKLKEHVQVKEFGTQSDKKEVKSTSNESAHESQPIKPIEQNAKNEIEKTPNTASKASTEDKKQVTENAETETPIPGKQITSVEPLKQNAPVVEKKAGTESKIVVKKSESKLPPSTQKSSSCSLL
ncbi:uncharacterized protein LOC128225637 isoform X2 [Mya arenaria]|uniref:uncharacterized protein LOC128225637 isoform X2 n=1 Tax=Mya arenaria TaxID=6604 RepID=UPI0022DF487C|nr:uncharacterized protein LOC128225637 isoform X2 [Mya arenaria]